MSHYPDSPFARANRAWLRAVRRAHYLEVWRDKGSLYDDNFEANFSATVTAALIAEFGPIDDRLPEQYFSVQSSEWQRTKRGRAHHYDLPNLYQREHDESLNRILARDECARECAELRAESMRKLREWRAAHA